MIILLRKVSVELHGRRIDSETVCVCVSNSIAWTVGYTLVLGDRMHGEAAAQSGRSGPVRIQFQD